MEEKADSPKQGTVPPSISLPKGGGAIRGIDEKFAANPVTGTGSMSVPIAVSPGRSGFGPQLNLSYDSGSGNSPFGFGWSLSIPSITRKTDKGLPKYQDADESDVFILSGAEDLVPLLSEDGSQFKDDTTVPGYIIHRYRPRIEGLFARIERWTKSDGDVHWRSISKDNILTLYGKDDNSRIYDPDNPQHIFSWLICETRDDKGNAVSYEYRAEDGAGVGLTQVNERNRGERDSVLRKVNRYIKYIRYGNRTSFLDSAGNRPRFLTQTELNNANWMFEVVFDYGDGHYDELPLDPANSSDEQHRYVQSTLTPTRDWLIRQDPFSSYRAGFEERTYRLCRRVLMFHHFPDELGTDDYLVHSTEFAYAEDPVATFITSVTHSGYVHKPSGSSQNRYLKKSLPPVEFEYSQVPLLEQFPELPIRDVDDESLENMPAGLDGSAYQWIDLDGEGTSGILTEQADGWYYKRNLSANNQVKENEHESTLAHFGATEVVAQKPASGINGGAQFLDLAGDGQVDLVQMEGVVHGFYERTKDANWASFRSFDFWPNLDIRDPDVKFIDLTGEGHADILVTESEALTWYPSLAEEGFGPGVRQSLALDEERGPRLVFADGTQSIYLADLSGDGLSDLARIRNGEVCYWPNLGYGRFGTKVTMDNAPLFDAPDQFDQRRIRLADIDGSGTTDIIYLHRESVRIYFNESGNGWSGPVMLPQFPAVDNIASVQMVDLLGNGTACLVWSSPLPGDTQRPMRYIALMDEKPHLLIGVKNNLGAESRVHYAPSTKFYLNDKQAGQPWITRLPFPVHVVERVETYDHISRNRFVTRYAYHHGYFDGEEREFRGFGRVDQWDTEEIGRLFSDTSLTEDTNWDATSFVPPILTRTWFHTGAYIEGGNISKQFEHEYYHEGDPSLGEGELTDEQLESILLPDTLLPEGLTAQETREACRSLKGGILRQEIYALDKDSDGNPSEKSDRPYSVSERNYTIKRLQPKGSNKHAVFFTHARETIDFHYERNLVDANGTQRADPRVSHAMTLDVDDFGNVLRALAIGYRRRDVSVLMEPEQKETHVTLTVNRFANKAEEMNWYRIGLPVESRNYEIVKPPEPAIVDSLVQLFGFAEMVTLTTGLFPSDQAEPDASKVWPYEKWDWRRDREDSPTETYLRLIEHVRTLYRMNDLSAFLPLGEIESLALPGESYKLAFTTDLLRAIFVDTGKLPLTDVDNVMRMEGGYVHSEGDANWWIPSGQIFYSPDPSISELDFSRTHFFLPHRYRDPFHTETNNTETVVGFDTHNLLIRNTRDALENTVIVENDYRVLQPHQVTDPNGNRTQVIFDALGMVAGTAIMGKENEPDGSPKGDLLDGFEPDLTQYQLEAFMSKPREAGTNPDESVATQIVHDLLQKATTRIVYDLDRYQRIGEPPYAATIARETHVSDLTDNQFSKLQISFSYSDGFGREIQKKIQAEPGPVVEGGPDVSPRWVGNGWTIFNNKGKPVRQYEPFFDDTHQFRFGNQVGVSPILFYDPAERVVATLHPNHTYEKVVFDPWQQRTYDVNDTLHPPQNVDDPPFDPRNDPDVGGYFQNLPVDEYLPTWYDLRTDAEKALQEWPDTDANGNPIPENSNRRLAEKKAAQKTEVHADTPTVTHFDSLGRAFLTIAHNKFEREGTVSEDKYRTSVVFDIEGNQREVIDAKERIVMSYGYDMLGNRVHQFSMDAGERWTLNDVTGKPIRAWDSRGHEFQTTYDALRRPVDSYLLNDGSPEKIKIGHTDYGESAPNSELNNTRGKVILLSDQAGVVTSNQYDFKGNPLQSQRQLAQEYKNTLNWDVGVNLEVEIFTSRTRYDAFNRPTQSIAPHSNKVGTSVNVIQPIYNEANLLEEVHVWLNQAAEPAALLDPTTADLHAVTNIDYDAKGQRELIEYGNGAYTEYSYDPLTFRLINLTTTRSTDNKQLQNLSYTYDPVGNITSIRDEAQPRVFFDNDCIDASNEYQYDALYRLIGATGREHKGQDLQPNWDDSSRMGNPIPYNCQDLRRYSEFYRYDEVGNIRQMVHHLGDNLDSPGSVVWNRRYQYALGSNRLRSTSNPGEADQPEYSDDPLAQYGSRYTHDIHGNMEIMPHLSSMEWDFKDQLQASTKQNVTNGITPETTYYVYDASGQRVRKVTERQNGTRKNERIYLGDFEIYREYNGANDTEPQLERETLHILDDKQRIALVETKIKDSDVPASTLPEILTRYQLSNHLGSTSLELNDTARVISYEENYPYGTTAYQAMDRDIKAAAKRYRYTGKERDDESGLYYHGARYYAPWMGRWTSCDPIGWQEVLGKTTSNKWNSKSELINGRRKYSNMFSIPSDLTFQNIQRISKFEVSNLPELYRHLNLYEYCYNRPTQFIDPDGFVPDAVAVPQYMQEFLANTQPGELTARREGRVNHAYVPNHGLGGGAHSGITIGIGVEVRHQHPLANFTQAIGADQQLTAYLQSVPPLTGVAAEHWVQNHPSPILTDAQVYATYPFLAQKYEDEVARPRLTGTARASAVNADPSVRLTIAEYNALNPRVRELLVDIAINSAQMAYNRQNRIAAALQVQPFDDPDVQTYSQLQGLRNFIASLPEKTSTGGTIQGRQGRQLRLGWIDARMHELEPRVHALQQRENPQFNELINELATSGAGSHR